MKLLVFCISILLCSSSLSAITRYVTPSGAGAMNGTSWANAFPGTSLQAAINASAVGDEVWVAFGTYNPPLGQADPRNNAFSLRNGVAVYGGFHGTEISLAQRRTICGQASILSGEIGAPGNTDNCYHVIRNGNLNASAVIDGFTIRDANNNRAISSGESGNGGGIYNGGSGAGNNCSPTIRNCIITNNTARYGAGIFNNGFNGGTVSPTISQCVIANNTGLEGGGGMDFFAADGGTATPFISNTIVTNNVALDVVPGQGGGGAMYLWGGTCTPTIINCVFTNNSSQGVAGGIIIDNNPIFGGVSGVCNVIVQNSVFWGNTAVTNGPQFSIKAMGTFTATYSFIDMAAPGQVFPIAGTGTGNILAGNPNFLNAANPIGADGCWLTADDGLQLQNTSPCMNAGNNSGVSTTDLWGVPRIVGGTVDIGAFEYRALTISSFTPTSAGTGAAVIITGSGFIGTTSVSFGGTPAASFSIDSDTQITATLAAGASGNVEVTAAGTATLAGFTFLVAPMAVPPTLFSAATPPAGTTNTPYSYQFVANGSAPQTYSLQSGVLPSGLLLSATGMLSGTPVISGVFGPIVIRVTNASGLFDSSPIFITVNNPITPPVQPSAPVFSPTILSNTRLSTSQGIPIAIPLTALGNPAPTLTLQQGRLPVGLIIGQGTITGIPAEQGSFTVVIQAANNIGSTSITLTIDVGVAVPMITEITPSEGFWGSTITISGYNLDAVRELTIGGIPVQQYFATNTAIRAIAGAGTGQIIAVSEQGSARSAQSFTLRLPAQPILNETILPTITTGDSDVLLHIRGRNLPPFIRAEIMSLDTGHIFSSVAYALPVRDVSETGATLSLPVAARFPGTKRITLTALDERLSVTMAIIPAQAPIIQSVSVESTLASASAFSVLIQGKNFFRHGFMRAFVNGEEIFSVNVLKTEEARLEIPARWTVRGGIIRVRLENSDGQSTEATIRIISNPPPFIRTVHPQWRNGQWVCIVRGEGFHPQMTAQFARRNVHVMEVHPTECIIAVPLNEILPTQGTISLIIRNPDEQQSGWLIPAKDFQQSIPQSISAEITPNPSREIFMARLPKYIRQGQYNLVNFQGEKVLSGFIEKTTAFAVDVRSLPSGIYLLTISGTDEHGQAILSRAIPAILR